MRQTSIEWLIEQITAKEPSGQYLIDVMNDQELEEILTKAFEMHIGEVVDGYVECYMNHVGNGESILGEANRYYSETYGGNQ
jgi:hypothetical protein